MSTETAMQWLKLLAWENGDKLPDHNKILLPSSLTKTAVYAQYSVECSSSRYEYVNKHVYDFLNLTVYYCCRANGFPLSRKTDGIHGICSYETDFAV